MSESIATPSDSSFSRAISSSSSFGTARTRFSSRAVQLQVLDREREVREAHVHHRRGMALAGGQVHHAAAGQQVHAPVAEVVLLDQRQHLAHAAAASSRRASRSISTSKWPALASTAPSRMRSKCSRRRTAREPVTVTNRSPRSAASERRHHLEGVHARLERAQGVDLADDHRRAGAAGALGDPLPVAP